MFRFLFSGFDLMQKITTENPRIIGLSVFFVFLFCAGGIIAYDVPEKRKQVSKPMTTSLCAVRSSVSTVFPENHSRRNRFVNDLCGEEAKAWSHRTAGEKERGMLSVKDMTVFLNESDDILNNQIASMTLGYPIELMATSIARYDREVAALIVGIAKKESNWGKRVPRSLDGEDCFNYWGWKGAGSRGVAMGHGCFGSPEEAVEAVGNRIAELVRIRGASEPKNFTIWKCGSSCAAHSPESVRKWVSDVDQYYRVLALR